MGMYRKICYKVEDVIVKLITLNEDKVQVEKKVANHRRNKEAEILKKRKEIEQRFAEPKKVRDERKVRDQKEVVAILKKVVDGDRLSYNTYEFTEVKENREFFRSLLNSFFEESEKGITFVRGMYHQSKNYKIEGYVIVTNRRVLFLSKDVNFAEGFEYQTIVEVSRFRDGLIKHKLCIKYNERNVGFEKIADIHQLKRVCKMIVILKEK